MGCPPLKQEGTAAPTPTQLGDLGNVSFLIAECYWWGLSCLPLSGVELGTKMQNL